MENGNNKNVKEIEAIQLEITSPSEENKENAAIILQYFFRMKVSKINNPTHELLLKYIKLKKKRMTKTFDIFKENRDTVGPKITTQQRSLSVPTIEIPHAHNITRGERSHSTLITNKEQVREVQERSFFKSSFSTDQLRAAQRTSSASGVIAVSKNINNINRDVEVVTKRSSASGISNSPPRRLRLKLTQEYRKAFFKRRENNYANVALDLELRRRKAVTQHEVEEPPFTLTKELFRWACTCRKDHERDEEYKYAESRLYYRMPLIYSLVKFLSKPTVAFIFNILLLYHVFVYMYLGILRGESSFYTGFMYSTCYAGVIVSYWILYRQKKQMLDWSYILSNELIKNFEEKKERSFNQYELIEQNQRYRLTQYEPGYRAFIDYCVSWELLVRWFIIIWQGCTTVGIGLKLTDNWDIIFGDSFDNEPIALYGYYNLLGQYIASIIILTSAATLFVGFYNLRCLVLCYAGKIREYRTITYNPDDEDEKESINKRYLDLRDDYLYLQMACVILGDVWTKPVIISSIFALQVIISNIFVIQKQVEYCEEGCSLFIIFPIIWCLTGIYLLHMILNGISSINDSSNVIKQVFTCSTSGLNIDSNKGDYVVIGGRERWLTYIDSNPIELKIGGTVVTKKYVINSISTIVVGVGSFALSNLLN